MIHLRLRTEYTFRKAYGTMPEVLARAGGPAAGIADNGTWGHVAWMLECKKAGVVPIFGVEIEVVKDPALREQQWGRPMAFLARNAKGLAEVYALASLANSEDHFFYRPRVSYDDVNALVNVVILTGAAPDMSRFRPKAAAYAELSPGGGEWNREALAQKRFPLVVCGDNLYPATEDRAAFELLTGQSHRRTYPQHILSEGELRLAIPEAPEKAFVNTQVIVDLCAGVVLPQAGLPPIPGPQDLRALCLKSARWKRLGKAPGYRARLDRELNMIEEKAFTSYFLLIRDMVAEARTRMLVGPARGSAAGSLVCFLLGITDVDPILHGLMFERFIDVTRKDLPDVDIDFPDVQREEVMAHLVATYGQARVGRLGTINRYAAKSALNDVSKVLGIPPWETKDLSGAIITRSTGDARAQFTIADAFASLDIGKEMIQKYPGLLLAARLEGHARHSGTHAAGFIVTAHPLTAYGTVDRTGTLQMDKEDAEKLNILKIDALGLRTLTVIQDCLAQIKKSAEWLQEYPLDDAKAFGILNDDKFAGIFQYEGYALQALTRQMKIREFNDIVAITALARPGPLHGGASAEFVARRIGKEPVVPLHRLIEHLTSDSYGTVIYQEQVMAIGRELGHLSWEHVSELRKAMSKSYGKEFFDRYWGYFWAGAKERGLKEVEAKHVWDRICTFGSWAFNKSHAVSYGLLSYWCCVLKAHYPLQFAAAALRYAKDEAQAVKLLRELVEEGFAYVPVDAKRSGLNWAVIKGELIGGLQNIVGLGPAKAQEVILARARKEPLAPALTKLLTTPKTPFDDIFEGQRRFSHLYKDPKGNNIKSGPVRFVRDIVEPGVYVFLAKIREKNPRDLNEYGSVAKRGGRRIERHNLFLNLVLEDDTGTMIATIGRYDYVRWGKPLVEKAKVGEWYLWKGRLDGEWRKVYISQWRRLEQEGSPAPLATVSQEDIVNG